MREQQKMVKKNYLEMNHLVPVILSWVRMSVRVLEVAVAVRAIMGTLG